MSVLRTIALVIPLALAFFSLGALAKDLEGWHPSAVEAARLPTFCWRQFFGDKYRGPQFEFPRKLCGAGTNHYCPALVLLNRANQLSYSSARRRFFLLAAKKKTLYTLRWIKKYPRCPLHGEAEKTLQVIEIRLRALGLR